MYEENLLMANIQVWICTMTSAQNRPFRHTSTIASLAVISGLSRIASDTAESTAKMTRQRETESKKARANKSRLATIDKEVEELNGKLEHVKATITDWFEIVYVHRYRDVDPRVRVECCEALTDWIISYPDMFFDGNHLRYLGWVLSDTNESVRAEVLKQLARLYRDKDKLAGLRTFTERFRTRIVEIATRDANTGIRASAVELLDLLREAGFLEPDDVDTVGRLIFDSEPKVRKAVVGFFAEIVNNAYELMIEDMGGQEALDEALAQPDDEEYENPRLEWLKMKCLVEQLLSYDEDTGLPSQIERITPYGSELGLVAAGIESRFSLAAQSLYDAIPEVRSWEVLAGYLLYDHSQTVAEASGEEVEAMLRQNCKLEENEETALLDILNAAVRMRLQRLAEAQKDKRKTKAQRDSDRLEQEEMAKKLTTLIPQLLSKFGALPEAAALCLRLERELNLEVFQELRQNTALTALLDDINKQFLTHHSERVLGEAVGSILHALGNDDLREMVDLKTKALWDDLSGTFDALRRGRDISVRGSMEQNILSGFSNIVLKMSELAKASEPTILDIIPAPTKSRSKGRNAVLDTPPITSLLQILDRGANPPDEAEDTLVRHTMSLMLPYFLWKCKHLTTHIEAGTPIPDDDLTAIAERRDTCIQALMSILDSRRGADELRVEAADLLLDLYNLFCALRSIHAKATAAKTPRKTNGRAAVLTDDYLALCQTIDAPTLRSLLSLLSSLESSLAKRLRRRLDESTPLDSDPIDPDSDPESSDDEEEGDDEEAAARHTQNQIRALLAEERLCTYGSRLVHAVQVGSLGKEGEGNVRARLERNKGRLSVSWREVVGFLDVGKQVKAKGKKAPVQRGAKSKEIVAEDSSEEEREEDHDEQEENEGEEDERMGDEEDRVNGEENGEDGEGGAEDGEMESVLGD